jgi:hypothetical protein
VDAFLWRAERLLESAAAASDGQALEFLLCVSYLGAVQVLTNRTGWSLPALAAEMGSRAVYRVERRGSGVRVQAWSPERGCELRCSSPESSSRGVDTADRPTHSRFRLLPGPGFGSSGRQTPQPDPKLEPRPNPCVERPSRNAEHPSLFMRFAEGSLATSPKLVTFDA